MKKQKEPIGGQDPPPTVAELLADCELTMIRRTKIDWADLTHCVRSELTPACEVDDLVVSNGVLGFDRDDGFVVEPYNGRYRLVCGFRRATVIVQRDDVRYVRCLVTKAAPADVAMLAATSNCRHGALLTTTEKRLAFIAAYRAHQAAGRAPLIDAEWHRRFSCSKSSIPSWKALADGDDDQTAGVQFGREGAVSPAATTPDRTNSRTDGVTATVSPTSKSSRSSAKANRNVHTTPEEAPKRNINDALEDLESACEEVITDFKDQIGAEEQLRIDAVRDDLEIVSLEEAVDV